VRERERERESDSVCIHGFEAVYFGSGG